MQAKTEGISILRKELEMCYFKRRGTSECSKEDRKESEGGEEKIKRQG